jgi:3,4-dihydroxy 2-butanone 4-phosphate synthase / GTP cyclohydrolase II
LLSVINQTLIGQILFCKPKATNFATILFRIQKPTMSNSIQLDPIEEAVKAIKNGEVIIVVDDEDRENEGDFICAAEKVTPEIINFMATHGRGLICAPLIEDRCDQLGLQLMVGNNTAAFETPFTVSVDLIGHGCTTGISASDRAKTIRALIDDTIHPDELGKPGHIFPLKAKRGGVLRRAGHTEAAIDFARLAGLAPAGVLVEIMNEDGTMARLPDLVEVAKRFNLKLVSIKDLIAYRLKNESLIKREIGVNLPTTLGDFDLIAFRQTNTDDMHLALIKGSWQIDEPIMVRVHSSCITEIYLEAAGVTAVLSCIKPWKWLKKKEKGLCYI